MYTVDFFDDTLALIKNDDLRGVVHIALEIAPAYFWTAPASMTGKYHPPDSNGHGGLCRHTKKVVWFAVCFARAYDLNHDALVAAAHLHDLYKYGYGNFEGGYSDYKRHGLLAFVKLSDPEQYPVPFRIEGVWREVCDAIRWHMGQWAYVGPDDKQFTIEDGDPAGLDQMPLQTQLLHLADMAASDKHFTGF